MNDNPEIHGDPVEPPSSMRINRIIIPVIIGLGVVVYLLWRQFDFEEFRQIEWGTADWIWFFMAIAFLVLRHLAYSNRLYVLSDKEFSFRKCIELIFIWEFSSAVSPTSVGGSAVALFVLSQEKLAVSKTTAIVIYTVVLDTIFFITTIPILFLLLGPVIIRPSMASLNDLDGWALTFGLAYGFMLLYGAFFFYALFIKPQNGQRLLTWISRWRILSRWEEDIRALGDGFVVASREIWYKPKRYHFKAFMSTALAWSLRFLVINCLIMAIVPDVSHLFIDQFKIYSRLETMFVILAFSPTPGGAGFHEYVFGGFLRDYVPVGLAALVALVWRLLTYYSYLLAGAIIIPNWLRGILAQRQRNRAMSESVGDEQ